MNPLERDSHEGIVFDSLELDGAQLGAREFFKCTFRHCKLSETTWSRSILEECVFEDSDLTRANPAMLSLRRVEFRRCKLMGIDWTHVGKWPEVAFEDCMLRYASFGSISLRKTSFARCAIVEANFVEADLVGATFEDCVFTGTRFEGCDLRRVRFGRARDLFVDPAKNRVQGMEVPLESALLLATALGMRVVGFSDRDSDDRG